MILRSPKRSSGSGGKKQKMFGLKKGDRDAKLLKSFINFPIHDETKRDEQATKPFKEGKQKTTGIGH